MTGLGIVMATSSVAATIAMEAHVTWTAAGHRAVDCSVVGGTQSGLDTSCRVPKLQVEGKDKFCESIQEDLKPVKNDKKNMKREIQKYCAKNDTKNDRRFLSALDKRVARNMKKNAERFPNDPVNQLLNDENTYVRLYNDPDFMTALKKLEKMEKNSDDNDEKEKEDNDDYDDEDYDEKGEEEEDEEFMEPI